MRLTPLPGNGSDPGSAARLPAALRARPGRLGGSLALATALAVSAAALTACGSGDKATDAGSQSTITIGLVTKTESNPYFVKLREAATAEAKARGATLIALAGKTDGDNEGQVTAIENLITKGAKGILVTPSNSSGVLGAIAEAKAKGIMVIALDTATDPANAVDATFATDNTEAGRLQGAWVKATLGDTTPKLAMLDGTPGSTVDDQRHQGFLKGFGVSDSDPAIVGTAITHGDQTTAQTAMENLLQRNSDINAIYTINEPAARGAYQAIKSAGANVVVGSIDGSCSGVAAVKAGQIGATVMQFPAKMAKLGVDAVVDHVTKGTTVTGFHDTGSQLITDHAVPELDSKNSDWGAQHCWG